MIADDRRAPFCYQTHDALAAIRSRFTGGKRSTAIAVYVVLTETANALGGEEARNGFQASRTSIAREVGCSVDTLDRYVAVFVEIGLLAVERQRIEGANLPNRWRLLDAPPSRTHAATPSRTHAAQGLEEPRSKEPSPPEVPPGEELEYPGSIAIAAVVEAWSMRSPPLIDHRASYLASQTTERAITRAVRVYPAHVVAAAVQNYAEVLAGPEYRWSYRWTLVDFLKRGLDRFVPEARPLENFRQNGGPATKFGRRDVSAGELKALADRLEAEDATG